MQIAAILFITISLVIGFFGEFAEIARNEKPAELSTYVETVWNALLLLAWAFILRNFM